MIQKYEEDQIHFFLFLQSRLFLPILDLDIDWVSLFNTENAASQLGLLKLFKKLQKDDSPIWARPNSFSCLFLSIFDLDIAWVSLFHPSQNCGWLHKFHFQK